MAYVHQGKFVVKKWHASDWPVDRNRKMLTDEFMKHFPHNGWTIMHHRFGNADYGDCLVDLHPWEYGDWVTMQNGVFTVTPTQLEKYDLHIKGRVDTEYLAQFIGKVGFEEVAKLRPVNGYCVWISLNRDGRLFVNGLGDRANIYQGVSKHLKRPLIATSLTHNFARDGYIRPTMTRRIEMLPAGIHIFESMKEIAHE